MRHFHFSEVSGFKQEFGSNYFFINSNYFQIQIFEGLNHSPISISAKILDPYLICWQDIHISLHIPVIPPIIPLLLSKIIPMSHLQPPSSYPSSFTLLSVDRETVITLLHFHFHTGGLIEKTSCAKLLGQYHLVWIMSKWRPDSSWSDMKFKSSLHQHLVTFMYYLNNIL